MNSNEYYKPGDVLGVFKDTKHISLRCLRCIIKNTFDVYHSKYSHPPFKFIVFFCFKMVELFLTIST